MIWLKQMTTSTFSTINKKIDGIEFLHRNKKQLVILAAIWCLVVVGGYLLLNVLAQNRLDLFLEENAAAAEQLAEQSGPTLLADEVLDLSQQVAQFTEGREALFTAILNHENMVVAHSDPERLNRMFEPLSGQRRFRTIRDVSVHVGQLPDGVEVATFSHLIVFSGVQIGSVMFGLPAERINSILNRYGIYKILLIFVSLAAVGGIAFLVNHRQKQPTQNSVQESMDGSKIGPYRLRDKIAQGGMAELYLADYLREDGFRRAMAVKRVLPHLAENQDFINMFIREARLAALLQHPNIVQIFDFGKIQNAYFIAMEYINGMNLGQIMVQLRTGLPINMAIFIAIKISLGLDYSHKRRDDDSGQPLGIVHRDISPQNILISYQGEVKISDFGISKANTEPSLTQAGVIKGKLAYLSPEQALGKQVDNQCDIYALGLVLYEVLSASRVYHFDSDIDAIRMIPEMVIPPLSEVREDAPKGLSDIIMKCLQKDKNQRYADARALHDDLMQLKANLQIPYDASDLSNFMTKTFNHA